MEVEKKSDFDQQSNRNGVPQTNEKQIVHKTPENNTLSDWLKDNRWDYNPFVLSIDPNISVGYTEQKKDIISSIEQGHKIILVLGPTGSGKTTLLKWVESNLTNNYDFLFVSKPPEKSDMLIDIFNKLFEVPWYMRPFTPNIKNIYQIHEMLNSKYNKRRLIVMFDEIHEFYNVDVLEWIRTISDHVPNMTILLSGLPIFETKLKENLETLRKRIFSRIEVLSLTKEEMIEMVSKRIQAVGGSGYSPFTEEALISIYEKTGGFPREILKECNESIKKASELGNSQITPNIIDQRKSSPEKEVSISIVESMTPLQRHIIDLISVNPISPSKIVESINLEKYKSKQHAIRSINNILVRMMNEGIVERTRDDKAFAYSLAPKMRTLFVNR